MKRKTELLKYLSKKTDIPIREKIYIKWDDNKKEKRRLFIDKDNRETAISRQYRKGGKEVLYINNGISCEYLPIEKANNLNTYYIVTKNTPEDFGITDYKIIKNGYKEYGSNGWTIQDIIEIDNLQFINSY